jgi:autotransporter-associated beta strand protein
MKPRHHLLFGSVVAFVISQTAHAATGTWNVDDNGLWSTSGNWSGGIIADDNTSTANLTNNITADRTVSLDSARNLNKLVFSDSTPSSAGSWILNNSGNAANTLTLGGTTPTLTVGSLGTGKTAEISAVIASGTDLINKDGAGRLILSGANTYTNGMLVKGGVVIMNNASANVGGSTSGTYLNGSSFEINGISAFRQSAGTITVAGATTAENIGGTNGFIIGGGGSYGAYTLSGGTLQLNDPWRLNPRRAQITQTGGAFNVNYTGTGAIQSGRQFFIGSGADRGVVYSTAGTTTISTASTLTGAVLVISDTTTSSNANGADLTIAGTADWTVSGGAGFVQMTRAGDADNETGNLNLNGTGRLTTNGIAQGDTSGIGRLNFNGGTLRAGDNNATFLTGLTSARIYSGGATIDTNGKNITIGQNLDAPTGNGLTSIALATGGSGYVGAPIVTITGGGGTGATAVADFDAATGTVTGITITSAGSGYTSTPTVTLAHGRSGGSDATLGTITTGALTGGGLTKSNTGTLTLTGTNGYTGVTNITGGTLAIGTGGSIASSSQIIIDGASTTLDVSAVSFTLGASNAQKLSGTGTVNGNITVGSNGTLAIGNSPGTMTFNNNLSLGSGSVSDFEINDFTLGNYDLALAAAAGTQEVGFNGGTLNLLFASGFSTAGTVKIFDFDSYAGSGFTSVNTSGLASGFTATFNAANGIVTVIPEPSAALLGGLGMLALLRRRRA